MATTTTNYGFNISEGTDLVNPLVDIFPNFTAIDTDLKAVSDDAVTTATELKTGTVHSLTRSDADRNVIRFTATSNFTAGETFEVDGVQVTALTTSGQALTTGAYIIGSEVLAILKGTLLTMFVSQNITDADTLDGHDSTYFATDSDMNQAQQDISDLSTKIGTAVLTTTAPDLSGAVNELNANLSDLMTIDSNEKVVGSFNGSTVYEKLIYNANGLNTNFISIDVSGMNISRVIDVSGCVSNSTNTLHSPITSGYLNIYFDLSNNKFNVAIDAGFGNASAAVISIRYTKSS